MTNSHPDTTPQVRFDLIGIVAKDLVASLDFYRLLGLNVPHGSAAESHVEITLEGGLRIAWDTLDLMQNLYPDWPRGAGQRFTLAFKCDSPAGVDALYAQVTEAGYHGQQAPWDAFWGQRYAVVLDPDGNWIDLFAPLT